MGAQANPVVDLGRQIGQPDLREEFGNFVLELDRARGKGQRLILGQFEPAINDTRVVVGGPALRHPLHGLLQLCGKLVEIRVGLKRRLPLREPALAPGRSRLWRM
jgi:hypothetical protein